MDTTGLKLLAQKLLADDVSPDEFLRQVGVYFIADVGRATLDLDRRRRCGFPEVIYAEGKDTATLERIFTTLLEQKVEVLATRLTPHQAEVLLPKFPAARYNAVGRTLRIPPEGQTCATGDEQPMETGEKSVRGHVTIVTAGASDLPVAEETRETALWTGAAVRMVQDVGVAGPHRLHANLHLIQDADAVVVVAGMEGALPSVVGGFVACPVIAVPTSVGYGAAFGGLAALLAMLNSCAANVAVVNIDAGFKGGYLAGLIARNAARRRTEQDVR